VIITSSDETVRVWDLATGTPIGSPLTGHTGAVRAVAAAELDGRPVIISGGDDGTVRVWDLATGTPIGSPLTGHGDWVRSVAAGGLDGRPVAISGGDDGTVRVWDLATGTPIGSPLTGHGDWVRSVAARTADSQERCGATFQLAAAIGNVILACWAPTLDDSAWWFEEIVALEASCNILALAWSDQRALAAATELGIVVFDLRR
jgi:WD40 repeat protein